jgi:trafficking protein particle complex subunit 13
LKFSSQIQNITANTICLERVELEPADQYLATSLNHTSDGKSVSCSINRLQPQNSCQFIYSLKPKPSIASDLKTLRLATNIGKLDIVWRSSNMAERGRLQTSQLIRTVRLNKIISQTTFYIYSMFFSTKNICSLLNTET